MPKGAFFSFSTDFDLIYCLMYDPAENLFVCPAVSLIPLPHTPWLFHVVPLIET
jgi:hypothetical protein